MTMPHPPPSILAALVLTLSVAAPPGEGQTPPARYRVEQVFRLETTSARPTAGQPRAEPITTAVEGRVRLVLEQRSKAETPAQGAWRFTRVEVDGPRADPPGTASAKTERALALGLNWMRQLQGQEFTGTLADLPVLPLGEAPPAWLTAWLQWAQTGAFAGVDANPVELPTPAEAAYQVRWLRSEFRQVPCHVQEARWTVPVQPAPASVSPDLAAEGVEARTHFAALSLEWVSQDSPGLVYAERSGVRETFWNLEKVERPELRDLVFRLRFAVEVRVERLP